MSAPQPVTYGLTPLHEATALSGLDFLRRMLEGRAPAPPFSRSTDIWLSAVEHGRAVFEGAPSAAVYNPIGTVHGGYAAALLDSACGCAVHSRLACGWRYTTLELKVAYHRPMTAETGVVRAEGVVLSFGRRAAFAEARLTDRSGRLLASATSSLLVMAPEPA